MLLCLHLSLVERPKECCRGRLVPRPTGRAVQRSSVQAHLVCKVVASQCTARQTVRRPSSPTGAVRCRGEWRRFAGTTRGAGMDWRCVFQAHTQCLCTALIHATTNLQTDCMRLLLEGGADKEAKDEVHVCTFLRACLFWLTSRS